MGRHATALAVVLVLCGVALTVQGFTVESRGSQRLRHASERVKRTTDKQFMCVLPINETANEPYIQCGIINETESEYPMPVDLSEKYRPRFVYALQCSNFTSVEDEDDSDDKTSDSNSSEEDSDEDSDEDDSEEDEENLCLRAPYKDCSVQCVYRQTNLLNEEGLPEADRLYHHVMELLNTDVDFKKPVKEAVKSCHKQLMDTVHKYGLDRLNMCLLLEIIDECVEFEIGMHCPKPSRIPYKKS